MLEVRHLANSAATLTTPAVAAYDLVRPGIAVYGLSPVPQLRWASDYGLVPAMTMEAELANGQDGARRARGCRTRTR